MKKYRYLFGPVAMLQRRPCTTKEISAVLGLHVNEVSKYIGKLERTNRIQVKPTDHKVYYTCCSEAGVDE